MVIYNSNPNSRSDIILFYYGERVPNCRHTFDDVIRFTNDQMENTHDFIQWLFPNKEASNYNEHAPLLTDEDIQLFKTNQLLCNRVSDAVMEFMWFLGFNWEIDYDYKIVDAEPTLIAEMQLNFFNHNHLRITRMIKFLKLIDHWLTDAVFESVYENCSLEPSKQYWKEAYNG